MVLWPASLRLPPHPHVSQEQGEKGQGLICVPPEGRHPPLVTPGFTLGEGTCRAVAKRSRGHLPRALDLPTLLVCSAQNLLQPPGCPLQSSGLSAPAPEAPNQGQLPLGAVPLATPELRADAGPSLCPPHARGPGCPSLTLLPRHCRSGVLSLASSRSGPLLCLMPTLRPDTPLVHCCIALSPESCADHFYHLQLPHGPRDPAAPCPSASRHHGGGVGCPRW